jgi:hypothetical protein
LPQISPEINNKMLHQTTQTTQDYQSKEPIYQCVASSNNGSWKNDYQDIPVSAPVQDHAQSPARCTELPLSIRIEIEDARIDTL